MTGGPTRSWSCPALHTRAQVNWSSRWSATSPVTGRQLEVRGSTPRSPHRRARRVERPKGLRAVAGLYQPANLRHVEKCPIPGLVIVITQHAAMSSSTLCCDTPTTSASSVNRQTYGFHPLTAWCDNTTEALAITLRPGNAGSNTATDHVAIITEAIGQLPAGQRRRLLITIDGAGASHAVVAHLTARNEHPARQVHYSLGFALDARVRSAIGKLPDDAWQAALGPDGEAREDAHVAELTGLLRHSVGGDPELLTWRDGS